MSWFPLVGEWLRKYKPTHKELSAGYSTGHDLLAAARTREQIRHRVRSMCRLIDEQLRCPGCRLAIRTMENDISSILADPRDSRIACAEKAFQIRAYFLGNVRCVDCVRGLIEDLEKGK